MYDRFTDCEWAAFDRHGQWVLSEQDLGWRKDAPRLRDDARREVPLLTKASKIPPIARLVEVVWVLGRAIVPWWVKKRTRRFADASASRAFLSLRMRRAIERLGST